MDQKLTRLLEAYYLAPQIYRASSYWEKHTEKIANKLSRLDLDQLRSGKYPEFATFGFNETIYHYRYTSPWWQSATKKIIRSLFITDKSLLPYSLNLRDIREMAFNHCLMAKEIAGARSIQDIGIGDFGAPQDVFQFGGRNYTMRFLNMYIRYCFAQKNISLKGDEILVELGSGSGHQVEILKKLYPDMTILLFDLPFQLFLCEHYLTGALGKENIVSSSELLSWNSIEKKKLEKGKVYFFGNWMFPLLKDFKFDVFWNAASFGEMEPHIVRNYLSIISGKMDYVYLLQARFGKETTGGQSVEKPITFSDYKELLAPHYDLVDDRDAMMAHKKLRQGRSYFEAVWKISPNKVPS